MHEKTTIDTGTCVKDDNSLNKK